MENNRVDYGINHFDPEQYIQTDSGSLLAGIKMFEAIFAGLRLFVMIVLSGYILQLTQYIAVSLLQLLGNVKIDLTLFIFFMQLRYPLVIPGIILLLMILDGIGVLLMRFGESGELLVRFVHTIYWIGLIIAIIYIFYFSFRSFNFITQLGYALGADKSKWQSLTTLRFFLLLFVLAVVIFSWLFLCNYHHDIRVVLETVHKERKRGHPQKVGKNHLAGRCTILLLNAGIWFIISAVLLIWFINHPIGDLLPEEIAKYLPAILSPIVLLTTIFIINLISFLKFLTLRICVRNFQKMHQQGINEEFQVQKSRELSL